MRQRTVATLILAVASTAVFAMEAPMEGRIRAVEQAFAARVRPVLAVDFPTDEATVESAGPSTPGNASLRQVQTGKRALVADPRVSPSTPSALSRVPEPASLAVLGIGLTTLVRRRRR